MPSSNEYNDHDYESLPQENIASFMAIFERAELIINYVYLMNY